MPYEVTQITWKMIGLHCCCDKEHIIQSSSVEPQRIKSQIVALLGDYHFIEMKPGLEIYLSYGVNCMEGRIDCQHSRHTGPITDKITDPERVHDQREDCKKSQATCEKKIQIQSCAQVKHLQSLLLYIKGLILWRYAHRLPPFLSKFHIMFW